MKRIVLLYWSLNVFLSFGELTPAAELTIALRTDYNNFVKTTQHLTSIADDTTATWEEKEEAYKSAQMAYKKIESCLSYLDHEYANDHFNGAPLPRIARKTSQLLVVDPSGLQIIGEVLGEQDGSAFEQLAEQLHLRALEFEPYLNRITLSERMVFESMREGLVRLAALGITGFDSPLEEQILPTSFVVLESIQHTLTTYNSYQTEAQLKEQTYLFEIGYTYFHGTTFADFDRFGFIKNVINPLYKNLLVLQKELAIATRDLGRATEYSVNYDATNLFDTDFLNYRYYSKYSNAGIPEKREELGKLLFFDPLMSHDNERSCASCHDPKLAFTDGQTKSLASTNLGTVQRNSPTLLNSVYNTRFFWDVRASNPEDQIEHVIFNEKEFNTNYDEILSKMNRSETYLALFRAAYPELQNTRFPTISRYTLVASISAYLQSLRSFNSTFDKTIRGEQAVDEELRAGFNIFTGKAKCATCHFMPTFAGNVPPLYDETETEVIGVPNTTDRSLATLDEDQGRFVNGRPKEKAPHQKGAFKTVSLRNIALTAPYMHNGVFTSLEEVMDFYNVGGGHGWGIAPSNATLSPDSLHLTPQEIDQVIYFLESLTDTAGFTGIPRELPRTNDDLLNKRFVGGSY